MVDLLELKSVLRKPIETLSKGFKRRVGLALALLHDPDVLILDEPTDGLDPNQKHHVRTLLQEMAAAKAIIISTHILEEVDALCTRAIVIAKGRIVIDARPARARGALELPQRRGAAPARRPGGTRRARWSAACPACSGSSSATPPAKLAELLVFPARGAEILDPVCRAIERAGLGLNEVFVERGRLDEVFRELTRAA